MLFSLLITLAMFATTLTAKKTSPISITDIFEDDEGDHLFYDVAKNLTYTGNAIT